MGGHSFSGHTDAGFTETMLTPLRGSPPMNHSLNSRDSRHPSGLQLKPPFGAPAAGASLSGAVDVQLT